jgi:hypothetical protein
MSRGLVPRFEVRRLRKVNIESLQNYYSLYRTVHIQVLPWATDGERLKVSVGRVPSTYS